MSGPGRMCIIGSEDGRVNTLRLTGEGVAVRTVERGIATGVYRRADTSNLIVISGNKNVVIIEKDAVNGGFTIQTDGEVTFKVIDESLPF